LLKRIKPPTTKIHLNKSLIFNKKNSGTILNGSA